MLLPVLGWALLWVMEKRTENGNKSPGIGFSCRNLRQPKPRQPDQNLSDAINSAQESIVLMVYSITDPTIIKALRTKAESGIPVQVIVDAKTSPSIEERLGPKISLLRRYGDGLMHMKILVIDHRTIFLGSANMTSESLKMHGNLVNGIDSPEMAEVIERKAGLLNMTAPEASSVNTTSLSEASKSNYGSCPIAKELSTASKNFSMPLRKRCA